MIVLPDTKLDFDEEKHIYTLRGIQLPSVTQIMKPMSLMLYNGISSQTLSEAANRGSRAHAQVEAIVKYGVVECDEDTKPYIDAFEMFQDMYHPTWLASEYRTYHRALRYAGTIDLIGYVNPDDGTGVDVIDLKTTASFHKTLLMTQVSAYSMALESHNVRVRKMYGLQLLKNGKMRFERLDDGFKIFLHSLAIYNAMASELMA